MQLSIARQPDLAKFAAGFSARVDKQLAAVQRQLAGRIAREDARRAVEVRARARLERREKRLVAERLPSAREGLARVMTLGKSAPVQQLIGSLRKVGHACPSIMLYDVSRPAGDEWAAPDNERFWGLASRDVSVELCEKYLSVGYGSSYAETTSWHFMYDPSYEDPTAGFNSDRIGKDPEKFFEETATPYRTNLSLVRNRNQRSYEWNPEDVVFEFFVSCARKPQFDTYVVRCMEELALKTKFR